LLRFKEGKFFTLVFHVFEQIKMYFCGLMRSKLSLISILLVLSLGIGACSSYTKLLKSPDLEKKYTAAIAYYKKKDYSKAGQLFDELLVAFKGDERFQEIYFYYSYCKYANQELITASYHFKNFYESFPTSEKAEEALYMHVYCDYLESYPYFLDPSVTRMAMDNIQLFINIYPMSPRVADCNKYLDELRGRLRKKSLASARLYLKMQDYQAAILAFNNTMKDYPELENKDEVESTLVKCQFLLADNSVDSKKAERYRDVKPMMEDFERRYTKSNIYYPVVREYYVRSVIALNKAALQGGYAHLDRGQYALAAEAFKAQRNKEGVENNDQIQYLVVRSYYKAGKNKRDRSYFQKSLDEANAFLAEFGETNSYTNQVKKFKKKAEKALN